MTEAKPKSSSTLEIFAGIAGRYDLANRVTSGGLDTLWRRYAARRLDLPPHGVVLDLASGTADLAIADVRYAGAEKVVATDVSEEMMAVGRAKLAKKGLAATISLSYADAQDLPFPDDTFDGATVGFGVRNFSDRPRAFSEIRRVLRPGGRFACLEFTTPPGRVMRRLYFWYLAHFIPVIGRVLTGEGESYKYLADSIRAFPGQEALAAMLSEAGFERVEYRNLTFGVVAVHVAVK